MCSLEINLTNRERLNQDFAKLQEKEVKYHFAGLGSLITTLIIPIFQKEIEQQLDAEINEIKNLKKQLLDLPKIQENFSLLDTDTKQLHSVLDNSSKLSKKINLQIQQLDVARVPNFRFLLCILKYAVNYGKSILATSI